MGKKFKGSLDGNGQRHAIIVSAWNNFITERLLQGACGALQSLGVAENDMDLLHVPGAFELGPAAGLAARSGRYDAVICIGCLIRGATPHFDHVSAQTARLTAQASYDNGIPVIFGVLTTDTIEQAIERAGAKAGNKGDEAGRAAVEAANLYASFGKPPGRMNKFSSLLPGKKRSGRGRSFKKHRNSHARELALQALYQIEIGGKSLNEVLELGWLSSPLPEDVREYSNTLMRGVYHNYKKDREYLQKYSHKDLSQISTVVVAVLRLGFWELREAILSHAIVVDDLLELVRKYDGEDSVGFVNGILDTFYQKEISSLPVKPP